MKALDGLFLLALIIMIAYTIIDIFLASRFYIKLERTAAKRIEKINKLTEDDK
ncbi:MAG: hypothetical protein IKL08_06085 [Clostridia bacterium]|nr:hypothetical protein [Clostridia bacterium]